MRPGQDATLDDVGIHMYGSTDEGGSFYVKTNTANIDSDSIFHAGDLNNWHWKDESTEQEVKEAEGNFLHEIKILKATCNNIDIVLFPVDPRIGSDFARGAEQFIQQIHVKQFIPMHFWEKPELTLPFGTYAQEKGVSFNLLQQPGESLDI